MRLFLYIDVDAFFASVEQSINPGLRGRPVMVGGLKHERGIVACPSYEARALGIKTGTSLQEATRLAPNGVFLKGDFHRYQYYSERFYDILEKYSPTVEHISQDEACLDIAAVKRQFTDEATLAKRMQEEIRQKLSLSTSIGVAPSRVISKMASEYKKPMGLTIISKESVPCFLKDLPIRKIPGIGRNTEKMLFEMGIATAGQLAAVPEQYLKALFGINGIRLAAYCRGDDGPLWRDRKVIRSVSRETGFADDITDRNALLAHFYYLLERASAKLRSLQRKAATVKIKFRYSDFQTVEGAARVSPPSNGETTIFPLVETMFDRLHTRRVGIRLAGVYLSNLKKCAENESFLDDRTEKERRLLNSLDLVRHKGGFFSLMNGRTFSLWPRYKKGDAGYELRTPSLSQ
jgi:DNA polymerase-4